MKAQANPTESTEERQEYLDSNSVGPNGGTGCRNTALITLAILLLALSMLACGASTYSYGVDTAPTMEARETIRAARNEARGIVPVGTLIPKDD